MPQIGEVRESSIPPSEQKSQTLFEQKEKLMLHIKSEFNTLRELDKYNVLMCILGHSIEDGFKLMQDLGLDNLIFSFFFQEEVQMKHPKLFQRLQRRMQELGFSPIINYPIFSENQVKESLHRKKSKQELLVPEECQILFDEIDSYYGRVLSQRMESEVKQAENKERNRTLAEKPSPKLLVPEKQKQREGMDMGVSAVERLYLMNEPHYYIKDFVDEIVWPELKESCVSETYLYDSIINVYSKSFKEFDKAKFSRQDFEKMIQQKSCSKDMFLFLIERYMVHNLHTLHHENFCRAVSSGESFLSELDVRSFFAAVQMKASHDVFDRLPKPSPSFSPEALEAANAKKEELDQKLKKIRYRGDIVDMRLKKLAEEKLLKELRSTLKTNQTLELNPETGEYAIYEQDSLQEEQETSLENLREFFDVSKWNYTEYALDKGSWVHSVSVSDTGDVNVMLSEDFGLKSKVKLKNFDGMNPRNIEISPGCIDEIISPDGMVRLECIDYGDNDGTFGVTVYVGEKNIGTDIEKQSGWCKQILKETFSKIASGQYFVNLVDFEGNLYNLFINFDPVKIEKSPTYFLTFEKWFVFENEESKTLLGMSVTTDYENVRLIFRDNNRVIIQGQGDLNSVYHGKEYDACVVKLAKDSKYYLVNTKDSSLENYEKQNYGAGYDSITPVSTAQGKVSLYVGVRKDQMMVLRPDGSIFIPPVEYRPDSVYFCTAIETPQGMGAVFYKEFFGEVGVDGNGEVFFFPEDKDSDRIIYSQAQTVGSFAVLPEEKNVYSPTGEFLFTTLNLSVYDFKTTKKVNLQEIISFTTGQSFFSVNKDDITIVGQVGSDVVFYRRSLSELKQGALSTGEVKESSDTKRKVEYDELDLSKGERLRLLNILTKKYSDSQEFLNEYEQYYKRRSKKSKQKQTEDPGFLLKLKRMIQKDPKEFLKFNAAEVDSASPAQIDWILQQLFPKKMRELKSEKKMANYAYQASDFLRPDTKTSLSGETDPRKLEREGKELVRSRTELKEPLIGGIYGKWKNGYWEKVSLPITPVIGEPSEQKTFSITVESPNQEYLLPRTLHSKIIPERVRGITGGIAFNLGKKEIPLQIVTEKDGSVWVTVSQKDIKEIVYSELSSKLSPVPRDVSSKEYQEMKRKYILEQGSDLIEDIASSLPPEWIDFLRSIKEFSPLEQIIEIQNFVRTIGYYDFDNSEMYGKKEGKPFQEQVDAMKYRMDELKKKTNNKALNSKQIAGICGDFALINAALLRKAGFLSVVMREFVPQGKGVKTSGSHAVAGFVWPGQKGEYHLFVSDATPSGTNEKEQGWLSQIQQPSIEKQVQIRKEEVKKLLATEVAQIERTLQELKNNPDAISQLRNGVLEQSVNLVLQHGVKESHCNILESVLGLARYGNIDIGQEIFLREAIQDQLRYTRETITNDQTPAGTKMFLLFEEYLNRFISSKVKGGMNRIEAVKESLKTLTKIIDIASPHLEKMEQLAARAILTDLQAKHMKK